MVDEGNNRNKSYIDFILNLDSVIENSQSTHVMSSNSVKDT